MGSTTKRSRRSRAQWQTLIERAERCPLGIAAFCQSEGISTASFYAWRRRLRGASHGDALPDPAAATLAGAPAFLDLGTLGTGEGAARPWQIELTLGADVVLRLRRG